MHGCLIPGLCSLGSEGEARAATAPAAAAPHAPSQPSPHAVSRLRTERLASHAGLAAIGLTAMSLMFWSFALLPLAMTMALIWKTKEVILDSVFGSRQ